MARILLGLETGSHADLPQAEFIECSAYRLEPITEGSYNDLDGEVIETGPIQGMVMPGAMKVFSK
jgi:diacylglycerol kinase family enzyme